LIAHLSDRAFFLAQVHLGDRVVARWSIDDVHLLCAEQNPVDQSPVSGHPCSAVS
jgi:hypothetical protein